MVNMTSEGLKELLEMFEVGAGEGVEKRGSEGERSRVAVE